MLLPLLVLVEYKIHLIWVAFLFTSFDQSLINEKGVVGNSRSFISKVFFNEIRVCGNGKDR
jgi:hypothetical protein